VQRISIQAANDLPFCPGIKIDPDDFLAVQVQPASFAKFEQPLVTLKMYAKYLLPLRAVD